MPLGKPFYHIIAEKLWAKTSPNQKNRLIELLIIVAIIQVTLIINLITGITAQPGNCTLCDVGMLLVPLLAILCLLRAKTNCALNTLFTIPIFVYIFYISDFTDHPALMDTVSHTLWWLLAGLVFLIYYSETGSKITFYYILSFITVSFQLFKANYLFDGFTVFDPQFSHPLLILTAVFAIGMLLRNKYQKTIKTIADKLKNTRQEISKTFKESKSSIAQLRAERDEAGNIERFVVEKVNNSFESSFKISLHEVQEQEAGYIFELVFQQHFDLNGFLVSKERKIREFHSKRLNRWFKVHLIQPNLTNYYIVFEDITRARKKMAELEQSKKRYKVLLEAIPDMFFIIGKDGVYEDFVIKESDLFKVEDANIIGSTIYDVGFPPNMAKKIHQLIQVSLRTNSIETIEYSLNTPNGTYLYEMRLAKLNAGSVISIARDITKRKTAEINLEKSKKKAEESDRLKSAFLSNLSHEIRTPLNIITNFTRMLAESELEYTEKLELSDAVSQNGKQLLNMIDNTIHLSKIETDSVDVKMGFCKLNALVRDIYNRHLPMIPDSKDLKMRVHIDVPNPVFGFETDSRILSETLEILVDNAIKFTRKGEVALGYEMVRNEMVKFSVSDTGVGIPEEEQENIFSRFYRVNNPINDVTSGSGLGLPIAQHYILLLGGELKLESVPGKGTTFWFTLPFKEGKGFLRVVS